MGEENISQEFRLENLEEIKNYFIKEIDQNELMSSTILNYIEYLLILASVVTACVFPSLLLLLWLVFL